jgi:AcrR family transcriptional regulator
MPKVAQSHLDDRRRQIVDAARARFAQYGFARTSMSDIVTASGLSTGAIYRYFTSKDDLVMAVCEQAPVVLPSTLTEAALADLLRQFRERARDHDHARLSVQIYAEASYSPTLAALIKDQWTAGRNAIAEVIRTERPDADVEATAEAFLSVLNGFTMQLAVRGDLDAAPYTRALLAIVGPPGPIGSAG